MAVPGLLSLRGDIPAWDPQGRVGQREQRSHGEGWGLQELGGIPRQEETTEAVRCLHPPEFGDMVTIELVSITPSLPFEFNPRYL